MSQTISLNDILECRLVCHNGSQYSQNVLHYKAIILTAPGPSDENIAVNLDGAFAPLLKAFIGTAATYTGVIVQIIKPVRFPQVSSVASAGAGSVTGDLLPPQTAGLVSLKTATATRKGRGRKFFPFTASQFNTATGTPTAPAITALDALGAQVITNVVETAGGGTVTLTPVLYNRATFATIDLTDYKVNPAWATTRRRSFVGRGDANPI